MKPTTFEHVFVEFIPTDLHDGMLYVSIPYATDLPDTVHRQYHRPRNVLGEPCTGCGRTPSPRVVKALRRWLGLG